MCVCGFPSSLCLTGCLPALLHLVLHLRHCLRPISCSVVGTAWYTCGLSDIKTFLWALLEFQIIQDVVSEVSFPLGTIHVQATQQCPAHLGQLVETFTKLLWSVCSTDSKLDNMRTWRVILCGIKRGGKQQLLQKMHVDQWSHQRLVTIKELSLRQIIIVALSNGHYLKL